jgi:hypothetical protein
VKSYLDHRYASLYLFGLLLLVQFMFSLACFFGKLFYLVEYGFSFNPSTM